MKVSIIIPVYNGEKFLRQCIDSALGQSYPDIEIIVVDDGSNDNTPKIINDFNGKITGITKKNEGTASALNTGIKAMKGEWFKWLSADDVLHQDAVKTLIEEVNKLGGQSKSCILYSNYELIDDMGNIIDEFIEPNYNNLENFDRNVILLDHYYGNGTTSLIHKSVFEKCGLFDEKIGFKEDYEFFLRCCLFHGCKLHLIEKTLAKYRIHTNQLTKKRLLDSLEQVNLIRAKILDKLADEEREKYVQALKLHRKQKPIKVRMRGEVRDIIFSIFPRKISEKILSIYMSRKEY